MIQAFSQHLLGSSESEIWAYFMKNGLPWVYLLIGLCGVVAIAYQFYKWLHDVENRPKHLKHIIISVIALALFFGLFSIIIFAIVNPLVSGS